MELAPLFTSKTPLQPGPGLRKNRYLKINKFKIVS